MRRLANGAVPAAILLAATVFIAACRDATGLGSTGGLGFKQISAGWDHTCALTASGDAYCWGANAAGQLGDSSTTMSSVPVKVVGGLTFASVSVGWSGITCGITTAGAAYCWGDNWLGELGSGVVDSVPHPVPVAVIGGHTFRTISAGSSFACAVEISGAAYCWGGNWFGELGIGATDTVPHGTPVAVGGGVPFSTVSGGIFQACALTATGAAWCWGLDEFGMVGTGDTVGNPVPVPAPSPVIGGHSFTSIDAAPYGTCALAPDDGAWCWGVNENGEMGLGVNGPWASSTPILAASGLTLLSVSQGEGFSCGVTTDNHGWCWGAASLVGKANPQETCFNSPGGTVCWSPSPQAVDGGHAFVAISAGREFACGLTTDGKVWCWGANDAGQLGDGTTIFRTSPVRVLSP